MATSAQLQAELSQLQDAAVKGTAQLQTDLKAIGAAPVSQDWLNTYLSGAIGQGGIGGTVSQIQAQAQAQALIPAGAPAAGAQAVMNDLSSLLTLQTQIRAVYAALHPEGFNWLGIIPFFFVAGLGYALAIGATTATAATAAASTATGGGAGLAAAGGATAAELGTTASGLAAASSALGGTTTSAVAQAAVSAVTDLTGSSTLGGIVGNIVNGIGGLVADIENIISPLVSAGESVLKGVEELNNNFIKPVVDTIGQDYNTIQGLIGEIHTLAHAGIEGILAIPDALSKAFTSLDAANLRLAQATGNITRGIVAEELVPGLGAKIGSPLGDIHGVLNSAWNTPVPDVGNLPQVTLDESLFNAGNITENFNRATKALADQGVIGKAVAVLVHGLNDIFGYLASVENLVELARQKGNTDLPVETLAPAEVIDAWWKLHFDENTALTELARQGIDVSRARLLYSLKEWLPDATTALTLFYKGIITFDEVNSALKRQGYSAPDIEALSKGILETVNPREAIQYAGRFKAAADGFLSATLGSAIPDELKQLYPPRLARADIGNFDWIGHWRIPEMAWWITAYFRGRASEAEVEQAARANNIPEEVIPHLIGVEQELIPLWMIPDMLASGIFTEEQAVPYLKKVGLTSDSAEFIVKYGNAKNNAGTGVIAESLAGIGVAQAKTMFQDGIINEEAYLEILVGHKYTPAAAALTVALAKQEIDLSARKTFANGLIKQVEAGQISEADLQTGLYNEGFTTAEVRGYLTQLKGEIAAKAKLPTLAEVKEFWVHGIVNDDIVLELLTLDGYAPNIAQAFLTLWKGGKNAPTNTSATA